MDQDPEKLLRLVNEIIALLEAKEPAAIRHCPQASAAVVQFRVAMISSSLHEIKELCSQITKEPNTAKLVPMLARLRKLLAELQVTTNKIEGS